MSKKIKFNFDKMSKKFFSDIGDILVKQARDNMKEISYGRVYIIKGKKHIASKPGDTANNLSGDLSSTIRYQLSPKVMIFGGGNGTVNYARRLEKNLNRPNFYKSIEQNKNKISAIINKSFKYTITEG